MTLIRRGGFCLALLVIAGSGFATYALLHGGPTVAFAELAPAPPALAVATATPAAVSCATPVPASKGDRAKKDVEDFFAGPIPMIEIKITPAELEHLKKDERYYVEATLVSEGKTYPKASVRLKGSAGSFQSIGGKPGFSLNLDRLKGSVPFHGIRKFHLNNSVQDGTFLHEQMAGEIARAAGVPASRCTHAFVRLNGKDLGLYVFKEAFDKDFLTQFYGDSSGDVWDGGFVREIDENMEKDLGDPEDKQSLKDFIAVCKEPDNAKRWDKLTQVLDVDRFALYCAVEDFVGHWDGYNFNRNNYRLYRDTQTGKFSFFLHGMDQTFTDPNFPVQRDFGSMVGSAFMRCPQGPKLYREKLDSFYEKVIKGIDWAAKVEEKGAPVRDAWAARGPQQAKEFEGHIAEMKTQLTNRIANFGKQLGDIPKPADFDKDNVMKLTGGWAPASATGDVAIAEATTDGKKCYHILAKSAGTGSWRKSVTVPAGKYRFEAQVRTAAVQPLGDANGKGALLRASGGQGQQFAEGDSAWKPLAYEFESTGAAVTLVAELRAQKGEAWFAGDSMRLIWVKPK